MKKHLLSSAAALTLLALPLHADPALDAFVGLALEGAVVSFDAKSPGPDGSVYQGLELRLGEQTVRFDKAEVSLLDGRIGLRAEGVAILIKGQEVSRFGRADLLVPEALKGIDPDAVATQDTGGMSPELCDALATPLRADLSDIDLKDGFTIGGVELQAVVLNPETLCLLDLTQSMRELQVTGDDLFSVRVPSQTLRVRSPVMNGLPETAQGETYLSDLVIEGMELLQEGAVQVRFGRISATSILDGDSTLPLVAAGYNLHARALNEALAEGRSPSEQLPYADLWNGLIPLNTSGGVRVSGVQIVGDAISGLLLSPGLFQAGSTFDLVAETEKSGAEVRVRLGADGSDTLLFGLEAAFRMEPADPSFNALSPRSLVMAAPISLISGELRLSDRGVGRSAEAVVGMDPYLLGVATLSGLIGAENGVSVAGWLDQARDGGEAVARVAPASPIPLLMLGVMGLGDWGTLGAMLNFTR